MSELNCPYPIDSEEEDEWYRVQQLYSEEREEEEKIQKPDNDGKQ